MSNVLNADHIIHLIHPDIDLGPWQVGHEVHADIRVFH